jgi:hypothetical protein
VNESPAVKFSDIQALLRGQIVTDACAFEAHDQQLLGRDRLRVQAGCEETVDSNLKSNE